jgi:hypothetical protein
LANIISIGLRSGGVGRQEEELGADGAQRPADGLGLVAAEIVDDDDIAWLERGDEHLLDIGEEAFTIDRSIEHARRVDAVDAQRADEGQRAPMPVRRPADEALAARIPAADRRHVGLDPGLVDKDETAGVDLGLVLLPACSAPGYVRSILLAGVQAFF